MAQRPMAWKTSSLQGSPAPGNGLEQRQFWEIGRSFGWEIQYKLKHEQGFHFAENMLVLMNKATMILTITSK